MRAALIALLVAIGGAVADDPKPEAEHLYFSVKEGAKWVREVQAGEKAFAVTEKVTQVEAKDGRYRVTVEAVEDGGRGKPRSIVFVVSAKGLARVSNRDAEGTPLPLLKLGLKEGEHWTAEQAGPGGVIGKATYTVGKTEQVTVPAGKYTAIRIDTEIDFGMRTMKMTNWYAPGVGTVKLEVVTGDWKQTTLLKSFDPGK